MRKKTGKLEKKQGLRYNKEYTIRKGNFAMAVASKAVVTVLGFDRKGIIAKVSGVLYERGINILDISSNDVVVLICVLLPGTAVGNF